MSNYIVNPTYETPQRLCNGMIIQNIFIPVTDIVGVINKCGIQIKETVPTMMLTGCGYSYYNGEYELKTDKTYKYYKHKTNSCYVGFSCYGTYWMVADYLTDDGRVEMGQFFNYSSDINICPYDGWVNYEDYQTNIKTDFQPRPISYLCVNSCGPNAEYIWNGVVGLNDQGKCNEILLNQKSENNFDLSLITTSSVVAYWGDIILKNKITDEIQNIYRCNFTTGQIYKLRVKGYIDPIYAKNPSGKTFEDAMDFKEFCQNVGQASRVQLASFKKHTDGRYFYVKRYCYQGVTYSVYCEIYPYQDKEAALLNQSGDYINSWFDSDDMEQAYYTASYTGWHYYAIREYNADSDWTGGTFDVYWVVESGTEPTE